MCVHLYVEEVAASLTQRDHALVMWRDTVQNTRSKRKWLAQEPTLSDFLQVESTGDSEKQADRNMHRSDRLSNVEPVVLLSIMPACNSSNFSVAQASLSSNRLLQYSPVPHCSNRDYR